MPNVALFDMAGNKKGEFELAAEVFGCEVNQPVTVTAALSSAGTATDSE